MSDCSVQIIYGLGKTKIKKVNVMSLHVDNVFSLSESIFTDEYIKY